MTYHTNRPLHYDVFGQSMARFQTHGFILYHEQRMIYRHLNDHLPGKITVTDVGCGMGIGTALLARKERTVVGLDIDQRGIALAKELYDGRCQFECANWMNFDHGAITRRDAVVSVEVLEHVMDPWGFIGRLLAFAPLVYFSTPNLLAPGLGKDRPINRHHVAEYDPNMVLGFIEGFKSGLAPIIRSPYDWSLQDVSTTVTPLVYEVTR